MCPSSILLQEISQHQHNSNVSLCVTWVLVGCVLYVRLATSFSEDYVLSFHGTRNLMGIIQQLEHHLHPSLTTINRVPTQSCANGRCMQISQPTWARTIPVHPCIPFVKMDHHFLVMSWRILVMMMCIAHHLHQPTKIMYGMRSDSNQ